MLCFLGWKVGVNVAEIAASKQITFYTNHKFFLYMLSGIIPETIALVQLQASVGPLAVPRDTARENALLTAFKRLQYICRF